MKMSIVACAVLGGSAACAAAQSDAIPPGSAGAKAVKEYVCTDKCREGTRLDARAAQDAPAIFTVETADERKEARKDEGGALSVGRQYRIDFTTLSDVGDPFHGGLSGAAAIPAGQHADDSVSYQGRFAGLSTGSSWGKGDIDGSPSGRAWGMSLGFSAGPLTIRAAHQNRNVAKVTRYDQVGISMAAKNSIAAANMRFGWGTAYAAYSASRGWGSSPLFNPDNPYGAGIATTPSTNSRDVLAGVAVPIGHATTLLASYIRKNDRDLANNDARQIAVGASYAVSRRMDFYAACSRIQHLNGPAPGLRAGSGMAVNVGMRRAF
ncbi:porin [Massilia sp. ST3]|uniref:porin n=1 Tax=Massilia sp. ST3 TaxID=2824903 RepID=UPI001B8404DE|nr:porin [Massilia sp. ST3]MBQ5948249.1 porin [Massilia sp. ST3]